MAARCRTRRTDLAAFRRSYRRRMCSLCFTALKTIYSAKTFTATHIKSQVISLPRTPSKGSEEAFDEEWTASTGSEETEEERGMRLAGGCTVKCQGCTDPFPTTLHLHVHVHDDED